MGGSRSSSSSSTQNIDRRIAGTDNAIIAAEGSSISVQRLDAGLVENALKQIGSTTTQAITGVTGTAKQAVAENRKLSEFAIESTLTTVADVQGDAFKLVGQIDAASNQQVREILKAEQEGDSRSILTFSGILAGVVVVGILGYVTVKLFRKNG